MKSKAIGCFSLLLAFALLAPAAHSQQLVKRMKCSDFFLAVAPVEHRYVGPSTSPVRSITVQIVRDGCRPKGDEGEYVLLQNGPISGSKDYDFDDRYRGYTGSLTIPFWPGDTVKVQFVEYGDLVADAKGTFDYTYTIH